MKKGEKKNDKVLSGNERESVNYSSIEIISITNLKSSKGPQLTLSTISDNEATMKERNINIIQV